MTRRILAALAGAPGTRAWLKWAAAAAAAVQGMKLHQAVVLSLSAVALALPASASAAACGSAGTTSSGLAITNVRTANTSCRTGRDVARRYGRTTARRVRFRDRLGRAWTCRITEDATGTDEGSVARTKVRCVRGRAVVRLELRS